MAGFFGKNESAIKPAMVLLNARVIAATNRNLKEALKIALIQKPWQSLKVMIGQAMCVNWPAARLGLNPGTLRSRMKKLGIKRPQPSI